MAHTKFPVEVLTPEGAVFSDEVEMVSTCTTVGSIGMLAGHEPVLAMLEPTELRLYRSETDIVRYAQGEGYLQFRGQPCAGAGRGSRAPREPRPSLLQEKLREAQGAAERAEEGSEERARALREVARCEAFLATGS